MLKQAIEVFKKEYEREGDRLILDSYIPSEGTYMIVKPIEGGFRIDETVNIKAKKDKENKIEIDRSNRYFDFICMVDYYSVLLDMNKAVDSTKKIHSNNYLSFFVKKDVSATDLNKAIDGYYSILKDMKEKYKKDKKELELYEQVENEIGKIDIEAVNNIQEWIKANIFDLLKEHVGKDYLKIFFCFSDIKGNYETEKTRYQNESKRYIIPKIYNSAKSNIKIGDMIYGLPNDNMGLNDKKPYLAHKTRKSSAPYLISQDEVMMQKKFFDYLLNQANMRRVNIYIDDKIKAFEYGQLPEKEFNGVYLRIKKGKEIEIHDFDIIAGYTPDLIEPFHYKNYLEIDYEKLNGKYGEMKTLEKLHNTINETLFSKTLQGNYFTEKKDIPNHGDSTLLECILVARSTLFDYFYKGRNHNVAGILDKVSLKIVKKSILNGYWKKAPDQFNLRLSLKSYFEGGNNMADIIMPIKNELREKINSKETLVLEKDEEYYFAIGQLAQFLISKSKAGKKPLSLLNTFISSTKDELIKLKLKAIFQKYNYDIDGKDVRFKNLYAMAMSYVPEKKVNTDMVIAGYLHSSLLYEKKGEV